MKNSINESKYILFFHEIDKTMTALVGGKGANLGEMTQAGFPVPPGFCLTTNVYRKFAAGLHLEALSGEEARRLIAGRSIPEDCIKQMEDALSHFPKDVLFSVRSSATAEDLPYASFAGQQDTYLNVSAEGLCEAVKNCFISLYTDRAVSYRRQNKIKNPHMSVVIQQMVRSDASGVMFSADPVSGRRSTLVIDAIFGLGETMVSGLVSPDHIEYDKIKNTIIKKNIACKSFAMRPVAGGGTVREELNSEKPVLSKEQIYELAELGKGLESHYGCPQDVEWAIEGGKLYCLQTRAITSLYPMPEKFHDGKFHFFYNMGYQQMNTKAMPIMALDCLLGAVNLENLDLLKYKPIFAYEIGQHLFVDYSMVLWAKPIRKLLLNKLLPNMDPLAASAIRELLDRKPKLPHPNSKLTRMFRTIAKAMPHFARSKDPKALAEDTIGQIRQRSDNAIEAIHAAGETPEALQILFKNLLVFNSFTELFIPMMLNGILALKKLEGIEEKMGCKGKWTRELQIGNEGNVVTEMGLALGDLADFAAADDKLYYLLSSGSDNLKDMLLAKKGAFGDSYREFMKLYGFRCAGELDISQPRWEEDPSSLIAQILTMAKNKEHGSHRIKYEEKNERAKQAGKELISAVEEKYGKKKAKKVQFLLDKYQSYYPLREHFKYFWMRNFGEARKLILRLGETMARKGQLNAAEDIMHLHMKEVYNALNSGEDMRSLVSERKMEFERVSRLTPPRILTCEGEVLMGDLSKDGLPKNALAGVGVSPGSVEGIAKVVLDPKNAVVEKGEILIAPYTDPGWTPLFVDAVAVVTEVGGMLTHGAVVAREYGIPGVVGVVDATVKIKTGQKIRVDGTAGYIEILHE